MLKDVPVGIFIYFMKHLILCQPAKIMHAEITMAENCFLRLGPKVFIAEGFSFDYMYEIFDCGDNC